MPPTTRRSKSSSTNQPQQSTLNFKSKSTSKVTKAGVASIIGKDKQSSLLIDGASLTASNKKLSPVVEITKTTEKDNCVKEKTKHPEPEGEKKEENDEQQKEETEEKITKDVIIKDDNDPKFGSESKSPEIFTATTALLLKRPKIDTEEENEPEENDNDYTYPPTSIVIPDSPPELDLSKPTTTTITSNNTLESLASKVTNPQIKSYYQTFIHRKNKPVHQEDLSLNEKILRHFDLSSQYGPCIGITRLNRWKRAYTMGLNPPIEVLAVCLEEVTGGGVDRSEPRRDTRNAYIDEFLSTRMARE